MGGKYGHEDVLGVSLPELLETYDAVEPPHAADGHVDASYCGDHVPHVLVDPHLPGHPHEELVLS